MKKVMLKALFWLIELLGGSVEKGQERNPGLDPKSWRLEHPGVHLPKCGGEIKGNFVHVNEEHLAHIPDGAWYLAPNARVYRKEGEN